MCPCLSLFLFYLSVYHSLSSLCPSVFVSLSIYLSISIGLCSSLYLSVYLSFSLYLCLSVCLFLSICRCLSVNLSISLLVLYRTSAQLFHFTFRTCNIFFLLFCLTSCTQIQDDDTHYFSHRISSRSPLPSHSFYRSISMVRPLCENTPFPVHKCNRTIKLKFRFSDITRVLST